jgi:hypothetical protein
MAKHTVNCLEEKCEHFKLFYKVIEIGKGNYLPDFNAPLDKHCVHPTIGVREGININRIIKCPVVNGDVS